MAVLPTKPIDPSSEQAGQPENVSTGEQTLGTQSNILTPDDVERIVSRRLEEAQREQQRQRDKLEARIQKQYQALEAVSAKVSGQPLTDGQKADLRNEAAKIVMNDGDDKAAQQQAAPTEEDDPLLNDIAAVFQDVGVWVEENDPEAKELVQAMKSKSPRLVLQAAEKAAKAKQERLNSGNATQVQPPANPLRNVVLAGSGQPSAINPIKDITDPDQLWKMAKKR